MYQGFEALGFRGFRLSRLRTTALDDEFADC